MIWTVFFRYVFAFMWYLNFSDTHDSIKYDLDSFFQMRVCFYVVSEFFRYLWFNKIWFGPFFSDTCWYLIFSDTPDLIKYDLDCFFQRRVCVYAVSKFFRYSWFNKIWFGLFFQRRVRFYVVSEFFRYSWFNKIWFGLFFSETCLLLCGIWFFQIFMI